jgi:hypothetical protein
MPSALPYLASPGSIKTALDKIRVAATPDKVTGDFVTTRLQIKGGTGAALLPYLKKVGLVASDGSPTKLYIQFRNPASGGAAIAEATRIGYKPLAQANEYFYTLDDKALLALIVQVTGAEADSQVAKLTLSTIKSLKSYADFEAKPGKSDPSDEEEDEEGAKSDGKKPRQSERLPVRLGLSYTINLNLPATSDQAVFNAIFKSLRDHLLSSDE